MVVPSSQFVAFFVLSNILPFPTIFFVDLLQVCLQNGLLTRETHGGRNLEYPTSARLGVLSTYVVTTESNFPRKDDSTHVER